jgi:hypothetical protein
MWVSKRHPSRPDCPGYPSVLSLPFVSCAGARSGDSDSTISTEFRSASLSLISNAKRGAEPEFSLKKQRKSLIHQRIFLKKSAPHKSPWAAPGCRKQNQIPSDVVPSLSIDPLVTLSLS